MARCVVAFGMILLLGAPGLSRADDGRAFFEAKIRPVLARHCYKCHSAQAGKSEGGLRLDTKDAVRTGGDRGPAVVPGDPDASWLLTAISHSDPDLKMPPRSQPLPATVVADFRDWIQSGAPDPRDGPVIAAKGSAIDLEAGRAFWALQKPVPHSLPEVKDEAWPKRELDHFILAKLEAEGLSPSPDASPRTLLRRLHFDLVGLPPSPVVIHTFLQRVETAGLDAALEAEVDSLLASERFGERWGRHWLDVARFAESSGKESNLTFPYAWRYRDYVIDSFNADKPYDRFVAEQVAGDLLPYESSAERAGLLIATGFLALGPKSLGEMNRQQFQADLVDEQIDTVTRAVLASSVACARCHDHKSDPYRMEDYYALAGIFGSTKAYYGTAVGPINNVGGDPLRLPDVEGQRIFQPSLPAEQVAKLKAEYAALEQEKIKTLRDALRVLWRKGAIEGQLETVDDTGRAVPLAMGVLDREHIADAPLLERGEISRPGPRVPRGFPEVIELPDAPRPSADHSGRLELARWLTHPDHPLTARVMANRVWHHLFGAGIVRTVDNFGTSGEPPSHPELLDQLALQFVADGWSVKSLIREVVLSRTYRQASDYRADFFRNDPDNRLLWRANKRRLDAEAIRDAMLAVSGRLDTQRPEGSLVARLGDRPVSLVAFDKRVPPDLDGSVHRSVYLPVLRDRLPDVLDLFDFAEPSLVTGDRETTNVPLQALYLMNSPFVQEQALGLAERVLRETRSDEDAIRFSFMLCFGREPEPDEFRTAADVLREGRETTPTDVKRIMTNYCHALLCTAEFRNLD